MASSNPVKLKKYFTLVVTTFLVSGCFWVNAANDERPSMPAQFHGLREGSNPYDSACAYRVVSDGNGGSRILVKNAPILKDED